jgi:hypothetical protein
MNWKPLVTERRYNRGVLPAPANTHTRTEKKKKKRTNVRGLSRPRLFSLLAFPYCFVLFNFSFFFFPEIDKVLFFRQFI